MDVNFVVQWANATRRVLDQRERQLTQVYKENARLRAWLIEMNGCVPTGRPDSLKREA